MPYIELFKECLNCNKCAVHNSISALLDILSVLYNPPFAYAPTSCGPHVLAVCILLVLIVYYLLSNINYS